MVLDISIETVFDILDAKEVFANGLVSDSEFEVDSLSNARNEFRFVIVLVADLIDDTQMLHGATV